MLTYMRRNQNALATIDPDSLLKRISNGELLVDISDSLGVSHDAVGKMLRKLDHDAYRQARTIGITANLHKSRRAITEAKQQGDAVALAGAREEFRADAWFAEREAPEIYGQRTHHTVEQVGDLGERLRRARERVIQGDAVAITPNAAPHILDNPDNANSDNRK